MSKIKKFSIVALTFVTVIGMSGAVAPANTANAQSVEDLQSQIASLLAQIQTLQAQLNSGGGSSTAYNFTRNLTTGLSGADVTALQNYLISSGYSIPAGATGYFGEQTKSAVAAWQAANGVSPAVGYFGPISMAKYNELMADAEDEEPVDEEDESSELQGGEGFLELEDNTLGSFDIDLGDTETVYEVEVEANDSDIEINRVDFMFDQRPWLYFDEVNLLIDGDEVASLSDSSSNFTEVGSEWRARFTGVNHVVSEDDTADIALELVVKESMEGTRDSDTVTVDMDADGIRYIDGAELTDYVPSTDGAAGDVTIDFTDTFGEGSMEVSLNTNSPDSETFILDEESRTNGVEVLAFDVEAEDSDITVDSVSTTLTMDSGFTTTTMGELVHRARLYANGSLISTKAVTGSSTSTVDVVFDDLDYDIDEDDTVEFTVELDFNEIDNPGDFPNDIEVKVTSVNAENADFSDVNETGLAIGADEDHTLVVDGLVTEIASISAESQSDGTVGKYTFVFDVTAYGDTFYVNEDEGILWSTSGPSGATSSTSSILASNATLTSNNNFRINNGQTNEFTVEAFISSVSADGTWRAILDTLKYGTSDSNSTSTTLNLGSPDYRSGGVFIETGN